MTRQELKDKLTQLCVEYVKENGGEVHNIVFGIGVYPDHVSPTLDIRRFTTFPSNHIIA